MEKQQKKKINIRKKNYLNNKIIILILVFSTTFSCKKENIYLNNVNSTDITEFGAVANDNKDDTQFIQKAIDETAKRGGGIVFVPKGRYMIDALKAVVVKSNITLHLDKGAYLTAIPNNASIYRVILIKGVENVKISGGNIEGERHKHKGTEGEWGMGIGIYEGKNITIENLLVRDCWGDGIYIGKNKNQSENIIVRNVRSVNNRRQGLSITSVDKVLVLNSEFSQTKGTSPQCGITIEPNEIGVVSRVVVRGCLFKDNETSGISIYSRAKGSLTSDIHIKDNHFIGNRNWAARLTGHDTQTQTKNVRFSKNSFSGNVYGSKQRDGNGVLIYGKCQNCNIQNDISR